MRNLAVAVLAGLCACTRFGDQTPRAEDAGRVEAAGPDGSAAAAVCASDGSAFCDGFENGLSNWSDPVKQNAVVEVVGTDVVGPKAGQFQLRVTTAGGPAGARIDGFVARDFPPMYPAVLAARTWVLASKPTVDDEALLSFVYEPTPLDVFFYVAATITQGKWMLVVNNKTKYYAGIATDIDFPPGQWVCVEIDLKLEPEGYARLFIDDKRAAVSDGDPADGVVHPGDAFHLFVGTRYGGAATSGAQSTFFDEVAALRSSDLALGEAPRIGCR